MNERNPELLDRLAAEYVLGTLRGGARRRFERLHVISNAAAPAVSRWEDRLVRLALGVRPMRPSTRVWREIVRRLDAEDRSSDRPSALRPWHLALAAGLMAVAIGVGWYQVVYIAKPQSVAQFAMTNGSTLWRVELSRNAATLSMAAVGAIEVQTGHAFELWALPEGGTPVSLGLMPTSGSVSETLTPAQRAALSTSRKLAISLEPAGGSPTGTPTGPVLHVTDWIAVT